jgi:predicted SprT family Zn-dependent metalloprotease
MFITTTTDRSHCKYKTEEIMLNLNQLQNDDDIIFLCILHEVGHLRTHHMVRSTGFEGTMESEHLAWKWALNNMGDFPMDKAMAVYRGRIDHKMEMERIRKEMF